MAAVEREPEDGPLYMTCNRCQIELAMMKVADLIGNTDEKIGEKWRCNLCGEVFTDLW